MAQLVALLRGINVGSSRRIAMADLRAVAASCGFTEVSTYIASGNVLFRSDLPTASVGALLADAIADEAGFSVEMVIVRRDDLIAALEQFPYDGDPTRCAITFLSSPFDAATRDKLNALVAGHERIDFGAPEALCCYADFANGIAGSKLAQHLHTAAPDVVATTRNVRTVTAIAGLLTA